MINTILIVDDSKENINALRSVLEDKYSIRVALNGEMALRAMKTNNIDLVLLDVIMPEVDGFEVLQKMKENDAFKNIPVIFVTGELDTYSEAKGLKLGAFDYVTKPYNAEIVEIKVKNQLDNKMYRDKLESIVDQRTQELLASRDALIVGMSLIAESRDKETGDHIKRMQNATAVIAYKFLEMFPGVITREDARRMISVAPLHDVGKVSIPDAILQKPGKLTDDEFAMMKNHTVFGARVLKETMGITNNDTEDMIVAMQIAESHHERYDGTGYPHGLVGEEIPISARIASLADIFDALSSIRVYKDSFPREKVYEIIQVGDGRTMPSHFDPRLLEVFDVVKDDL